jgi:cellulose synthase/poly-beta-1,6-N-acetylglucosamine synthase-like glycosyltransferase
MERIMNLLLTLASFYVGFYLLLPFFLTLFSLRGRKRDRSGRPAYPREEKDFGIIITAYQNQEITLPGIASLLRQSYERYAVYLVADQCTPGFPVEDDKLRVFYPDPPLNLKVKSIRYAMDRLIRPHDYIIVLDADNLAHPDFLREINRKVQEGYDTVQGQRTAKNLDSLFACLDAVGEFYKNYVDRYAPYLLGSSSVISGSGMAVERKLYSAYLNSPEIRDGQNKWKKMLQEDKILQNHILRHNGRISYAWDALIYDEKVSSGQQAETQRSRWLYSYFQNIPNALGILRRGITGLNWNAFLFGLLTFAPPLFIQVFLAAALVVIWLFVAPVWSLLLIGVLFVFSLTVFWTLSLSRAPKEVWKSLWAVPLFVFRQVKGLLKMTNPNKHFRHTEHRKALSIEEVLKKYESEDQDKR